MANCCTRKLASAKSGTASSRSTCAEAAPVEIVNASLSSGWSRSIDAQATGMVQEEDSPGATLTTASVMTTIGCVVPAAGSKTRPGGTTTSSGSAGSEPTGRD